MYNPYPPCKCPYYSYQRSMYKKQGRYNYNTYGCPYYNYAQMMNVSNNTGMNLIDYGPCPLVINVNDAARLNNNFRTALWTGDHLQLTLMSIPVGGEIGLEIHPDVDQLLRIEEGNGLVMMGANRDNMDYRERVEDDFVIIVPAGTWHNLINTGDEPIKLFSVYAPPQHPHGTIHVTKEESDKAEY